MDCNDGFLRLLIQARRQGDDPVVADLERYASSECSTGELGRYGDRTVYAEGHAVHARGTKIQERFGEHGRVRYLDETATRCPRNVVENRGALLAGSKQERLNRNALQESLAGRGKRFPFVRLAVGEKHDYPG